jgi:PTS system N-acetylgalactosamine-specific IIA component
MAVRRLLRDRPGIALVTGVNLSLLLDFAMQDTVDPAEAAKSALERGKQSMVVHGV